MQSAVTSDSTSGSDSQADTKLFRAEEIEGFHRDGYAIVRGLGNADFVRDMTFATLLGLEHRIEPIEYEADVRYPGAPLSRDHAGGLTVRRLKEAHGRHPAFIHWIGQPEVLGRLQQLLGPQVVLPLAHHNCVMTKQPEFSSETHWHQDIRYWSYQRPELISVWMALRNETVENGCLQLIPGSHRLEFARNRYDEKLFFREDLPENQNLIELKQYAELAPGDVLFFHCRTLHAAGRNLTTQAKFSVVFTFRPAENHPLPASRSASMPELILPQLS